MTNASVFIQFANKTLPLRVSAAKQGRSMSGHDKTLTVPDRKRSQLGGFRHYYVVSDAGLTRINLSSVFEGFFAGQRRVTTNLAEAQLKIDQSGRYAPKLNAFVAKIRLGQAPVTEAAWPLRTEADIETAMITIQRALIDEHAGALTFLIAPGGGERLSSMFHLIERADIALRVEPMLEDWSFEVCRKATDFNAMLRAEIV